MSVLINPSDISKSLLGFDILGGQNITDMVFAVFVLDVSHNEVTPIVGEVAVDIREGDTLRIEETLKKEAILDWVNGNDAQTIRDK